MAISKDAVIIQDVNLLQDNCYAFFTDLNLSSRYLVCKYWTSINISREISAYCVF